MKIHKIKDNIQDSNSLGSLINGLEKDLIQRSYLDFPWITWVSFIVGLMEALRCADKDNYPGQPRVTMRRPGPGGVHCLMSHTLVTRGNINT